MQPPWMSLPDLPRQSVGWRMGSGEEIYNRFYRWFSSLRGDEQSEFQAANPEPPDWHGFYRMIVDRPWHAD